MAVKKKKRPRSHTGVFVTPGFIQLGVFNQKSFKLEHVLTQEIPQGVLSSDGDRVEDPAELAEALKSMVKQLKLKEKSIHLSVSPTLLRVVEMPRIDEQELYISLSSEAERYRAFDGTEAIVDFSIITDDQVPSNAQKVVFGAIRQDTLEGYLKAFQIAKLKVATIDLEPLDTLRAMAGTGVLDSLTQQIGPEGVWANLFIELDRIRVFVWCGNILVDLREIQMNTSGLLISPDPTSFVFDLVDEVQRTVRNLPVTILFASGLPQVAMDGISQQMGIPCRPCMLGPSFGAEQPGVLLPTVGASMRTAVSYPFQLDIASGASALLSTRKSNKTELSAVDDGESTVGATVSFAAAAVVFVFMVLLCGGLWLFDTLYLGSEIASREQAKQTKEIELSSLTREVDALKKKYELKAAIVEIVNNAIARNKVYKYLAQDLRQKAPQSLWVHDIDVGNNMEMQGKSVNHQAIIDFARSFDGVNYLGRVLINSIEEELIGQTPVYNFVIAAQPKLVHEASRESITPSTAQGDNVENEMFQEAEAENSKTTDVASDIPDDDTEILEEP